jgi:hypothetical protein
VHNLVLLYYRGILGLDDTGAALDSLGRPEGIVSVQVCCRLAAELNLLLRRSGLGLLDCTLSHCGGWVVRRGAEMRAEVCAEACTKAIPVESER